MYVVVGVHFDIYECGSPHFAYQSSFWHNFYYYNLAIWSRRYLYYSSFRFSDAALVACGFAYSGADQQGNSQWDAVYNLRIWPIESMENPFAVMRNWNHQTHLWLKYYVQQRLVDVGQKPSNRETALVFLASSLWHGFYTQFYIMYFFFVFFLEM